MNEQNKSRLSPAAVWLIQANLPFTEFLSPATCLSDLPSADVFRLKPIRNLVAPSPCPLPRKAGGEGLRSAFGNKAYT
jgi:hypothetical protein